MNEAYLVRKILKYINELDKGKAVKYHGNGFSHNGTPDILASINGRMFLFEVKVGKNKPTFLQLLEIEKWRNSGAIAEVVYSLEEVKKIIKKNAGT